ncbi:ribose 5-phosphate isomerase [Kosmotoga arenicorallina S304]|uniref:Ribose 5-phosphate isomerase n=1 Tax=Kosmotoga arenicorallina S304 TaxID=1453497 RepID=A0A176K4C3_9BACT|nr:ribose 5-phosphate isomerase B [Kosmotoga arenicorallina]OAA31912.1 ribose 5-phosphate isomerase [Kosmotoga arenicorallina S304]
MKIAIASDHAGYFLKQDLIPYLKELGHDVKDLGTDSENSVDYPDFAKKLAEEIKTGTQDRGILICGTGIGMSIAANRYKGVRAALCLIPEMAELSRKHNDANVLVLAGRLMGVELARWVVKKFLDTDFEGGRHARRVLKIEEDPMKQGGKHR